MIPSVRATEAGIAQHRSTSDARSGDAMWCLERSIWSGDGVQSSLDWGFSPIEGVRPVRALDPGPPIRSVESASLRLLAKVGGSPLLRLNTGASPIADKYREGKLQSTLKREFNRT